MKSIERATEIGVEPPYYWDIITLEAPFAPRDGAGALVYKDKMWLLGGWNPSDKIHFPNICNSEVWSSTDGEDWTLEIQKAPWEGRHCAGYVVHQDKIWILGGDGNQGHYQPDVWNTADGVNWELVCDSTPWGQRSLHHTVEFRDKIWVMGGQTSPSHVPTSTEAYYSDVWCSMDGKNWQCVTENAPWGPRGMIGGSVVFNDRMWIIGGGTFGTPGCPERSSFRNDVWSSVDGINWVEHTDDAPWHQRHYHEVAVFDNHMWVLEGFILDGFAYNLSDVWYSSDGVNWTELKHTPWAARHAASVFVYHGGLWMVAGNNMCSDVWRLRRADEEYKY